MAKDRVVTARLDRNTAIQLDELVELYSKDSLEPVTPSMVLRRAIFRMWQEELWAKEHDVAEKVRKRREARTTNKENK
jgi:hypothetical protein